MTTYSARFRGITRYVTEPLLRNSALMAANVVLGSIAGFVYWTVAARSYGTQEVGAAGAITSLLPLVTTCASLGLAEMLVRHYARERDQLRMLRRSARTVVLIAALMATSWWLVAEGRAPLDEVASGVRSYALLLSAVVATAGGLLTTATMIASRRPELILAETVVGATTRIVALVLLQSQGAAGILLSFTLGALAATLTGSVLIATVLRPRRGAATALTREQRNFALVNWVSALISLAPRAVAVTLIVWRAGAEAAAWVAIPLMTLPLLTIVPSVLSRSLFAEASNTPSELPRLLKKTMILAIAVTAAGMLFVLLAAPTLLGLFGAGYAQESGTLLRLLAVAAMVAAPNYVLDVAINVSGYRGGFLVTNVLGTGSLLLLLTLLSSAGPAGIGAAWVFGQACYLLVALTVWRTCSSRARMRGETTGVDPVAQPLS